MPCATSSACSRPEMSRATARLRSARRSACPHCGRETKTVEGVCADCWGTKEEGHRQFFVPKRGGSPDWFGLPGWLFPDDLAWLGVAVAFVVLLVVALRVT